jgi:hypothetical protein
MRSARPHRRSVTLGQALAVLFALGAACSAEPLMPSSTGGSSGSAAGGIGGQAGIAGTSAGGTTGSGGAVGGAGGPVGGAGGAFGNPCASTSGCAAGAICSNENGVCNGPPGCGGSTACPAVCYGTCVPAPSGPACGAARCATGSICCNDSCGICTALNEGCTKQLCVPPAGGGACTRDADCRVEADYCGGCDCRALGPTQSLPACPGPGVRCLVDPCGGKAALCVNGYCAIQ